jgi:hypothetical protein
MRTRVLAVVAAVALLFSLVMVGSSNASPAQSLPPGAIPLEGGGYAIPLSAPKPSWYTADLARRVHAAGRAGVPIPEGADIPASGLAFTGIRPGAWMLSPSGCTMNFVFGSGTDLYIGTAGHCANVGDRVTLIALPGVLMEIGTTVISHNNDIGDDFALVKIDQSMIDLVNPSMTHWGGPTSNGQPAIGDAVVHSGHGLVIGTGGTPRAGVVTYTGPGDGGDAFGWDGAAAPGDSGSAVRNVTGAAAGDLTHLVVGTDYLPAFIAGTTATRMQAIAGRPLATASLVPDPLP